MNRQYKGIIYKVTPLLICLALFFVCATQDASAQGRRSAAQGRSKDGSQPLIIKELPKLGKQALVRSPEFDGKVKSPKRSSGDSRWAMFEVEYATAPEWIDELSFSFYVMTQDKEKGFHFFQTAVSYLNIAKGEHGAAVLLPPSVVARYGESKFFSVEISINGDIVAKADIGGDGWVEKVDTLGERVTRHSGFLQDRSKTPFGMTFIDAYEVVR